MGDVSDSPVEMEVSIDSAPTTISDSGQDVKFEDGKAIVEVDEARLYNVYDGEYGKKLLRLDVQEGFRFNAFTFG